MRYGRLTPDSLFLVAKSVPPVVADGERTVHAPGNADSRLGRFSGGGGGWTGRLRLARPATTDGGQRFLRFGRGQELAAPDRRVRIAGPVRRMPSERSGTPAGRRLVRVRRLDRRRRVCLLRRTGRRYATIVPPRVSYAW